MRTAVLHPPVLDLPPPLDARILRVALVHMPQVTRRAPRLTAVAVIKAVRAVVRWVQAVIIIPHSRTLNVIRARGPPCRG